MGPGRVATPQFLLLAALACGVSADNSSRVANASQYNTQTAITSVLEMLEEMKAKGQQLQEDADAAYDEVEQVCQREEASRTSQMDEMARQIQLLQASIASLELEIQSLNDEIITADRDYANSTAWLAHLRAERREQEADYSQDLAEYDAAMSGTERALEVLAEQQVATTATTTGLLLAELNAVVSKVGQKRHLRHREVYTPIGSSIAKDEHLFDEFDSLSTATSSYVSQTGNVEELLNSLLTTFRTRREELINAEKTSRESFEQLQASLEGQIAGYRQTASVSRSTLVERQQDLASEQGQLTEVYSNRNSTDVYLGELQATCTAKQEEHVKLSALRKDEIAAVDNAITIITSVGASASLLRLHSGVVDELPTGTPREQQEGKSADAERVVGFLRLSADKLQSQSLEDFVGKLGSLVSTVSSSTRTFERGSLASDPLARVKIMISDLILKLQQQASEESSHKAWCDAELAKNEAARSEAQANIEGHSAKLEKLSADMQMLAMKNLTITEQLNATMSAGEDFAAQRLAEQASNEAIIEDADTAIEALNAAITLLEEYYGNVSQVLGLSTLYQTVQHRSFVGNSSNDTLAPLTLPDELTREPVQAPSPEGGRNVLALLEVIHSRYVHIKEDVTAAEEIAAQDGIETMRDHDVMVVSMEADIHFFTQQYNTFSAQRNATVEQRNASQQALADAELTYESLKPPCINTETYEERELRRQQELAALREAQQMLDEFIAEYGAISVGFLTIRHKANRTSRVEVEVNSSTLLKKVNMTMRVKLARKDVATLLNESSRMKLNSTLLTKLNLDIRAVSHLNSTQDPSLSEAPIIVRDLLVEIRDEVQSQLDSDTTIFEGLQSWCTSAKEQMTHQIEDGNSRDRELVNTIETSRYDLESAKTHLEHLQRELAASQESLRERTNLRMRQLEDFRESEKELLQSIVTLRNAIIVLESHYNGTSSLRNLTAEREELEAEKARLEAAGGEVNASTTNLVSVAAQVDKVLKLAAAEGISSTASSIEASDILQEFISSRNAAYPFQRRTVLTETHRSLATPASGEVVLGVLRQLLATFQTDLSSENSNEQTSVTEFNALEASLLNQISVLDASIENKQAQLVEATRLNAQATEELASVREGLSQDRAALQAVEQECLDDEAEFARRNSTRSAEIATLNDAIATLNKSIAAAEAADAAAAAAGNASTPFLLHSGREILNHPEHGFAGHHLPHMFETAPRRLRQADVKKPAAHLRPESIIKGYIANARKAMGPVAHDRGQHLTMLAYSANASHVARAQLIKDIATNWHRTQAALAALTSEVDNARRSGRSIEALTPLTLEAMQPVLAAIASLRITLQEEKQLEVKMHDTCVSENNTAHLDLEKRLNDEEHKQAAILSYEATINSSSAEIIALSDQISLMNTSLNVSREQRMEEMEQLREAIQSHRDYVEILYVAEQLLALYYDTDEYPAPALVQMEAWKLDNTSMNGTYVNRSALPWKPRFAHPLEPHGGGVGVLSIIQILIEETETSIRALEDSEAQSMDAYSAGVTETTHSIDSLQNQIVVLEQRIGDAGARLQETKSSLSAAVTATQDVRDFILIMEEKCSHIVANIDTLQAARQAEIDNLFEAKAVLEGMVEQSGTALVAVGSTRTSARKKRVLRGVLGV